jgi:hypothetical protein
VFAQQSVRELERTGRTPEDVMASARAALAACGWRGAWGADGDHLKTPGDVRRMAAAGFTFFTIDPSAHVDNGADALAGADLAAAAARTARAAGFAAGLAEAEHWYAESRWELPDVPPLTLTRADLCRAVVKYGRALAHAETMARAIAEACAGRPFEIELSVDETEVPTSPAEHLFVGLELRRRGIAVASLAPRFVGAFEKGVDYRGSLSEFEARLHEHVAVARHCGPYKISVHSGSDKFALYPVLGRVCGSLLHVKTAGTSYLEALRVVARREPALFLELLSFALTRYETDRASYHVSARAADLPAPGALAPGERERRFLDEDAGRQVLHVTFGSVLTARDERGETRFRNRLLEVLRGAPDLYAEVLQAHLGRHLCLLQAG